MARPTPATEGVQIFPTKGKWHRKKRRKDHEQKQHGRFQEIEEAEVFLEGEDQLGEEKLAVAEKLADDQYQHGGGGLGEEQGFQAAFGPIGPITEHHASQRQAGDKRRQHDGEGVGGGPTMRPEAGSR